MRPTLVVTLLLCAAACGGGGRRGGDPGPLDPTDPGATGNPSRPGNPPPDLGPAPCPALTGPFGTDEGEVFSPSTAWLGLAEGEDAQTTLRADALYDCDGTRGVHAIVLSNAAQWCGVCKSEARTLEDDMVKRWGPRGVRFWTLLYEDSTGAPATVATARAWRQAFGLDSVAIAVDPDFTLSHPGTNSLPVHAIIDPRTMRVVAKPEGAQPIDSDLEALLRKNGH